MGGEGWKFQLSLAVYGNELKMEVKGLDYALLLAAGRDRDKSSYEDCGFTGFC